MILSKSSNFVIIILVIILNVQTFYSQEETPTSTPNASQQRIDELKRIKEIAKLEQEILEIKKKNAETERDRLRAILPKSDAKALTGKVDYDDKVTFSSELLAYQSLETTADGIIEKIKNTNPKPNRIIVLKKNEIIGLQNYPMYLSMTSGLTEQYKNLVKSDNGWESGSIASLAMAPEIATAITKSIIDFVSLFKTDVDIKGLDFTINSQSMTAALSTKDATIEFYDPSMFSPKMAELINSNEGLIKELNELIRLRNYSERLIALHDSKSEEDKKIDTNGKLFKKLFTKLNTEVDTFFKILLKEDDDGISRLALLLQAETIRNLMMESNKTTYILRLKVIRAAGTNTKKSNLFTGTKLNFSGGIIIRFFLFNKDGVIKSSGIVTAENKSKLKI